MDAHGSLAMGRTSYTRVSPFGDIFRYQHAFGPVKQLWLVGLSAE